jgi:hypothetical protein
VGLHCPRGFVTIFKEKPESVYWNPYNKVVQDHRDGTIYQTPTDVERAKRGLPTPWTPDIGKFEVLAIEKGTQQ